MFVVDIACGLGITETNHIGLVINFDYCINTENTCIDWALHLHILFCVGGDRVCTPRFRGR